MFTLFKNLKLVCALSKAIKEVKKFLANNSDKIGEIKEGVELIKKGLQLIVKQVPAVSELFNLVKDLLSTILKKGK